MVLLAASKEVRPREAFFFMFFQGRQAQFICLNLFINFKKS